MINQRPLTGIREAVARAGSQTKLADELGVTRQSVQLGVKQGYVPLEYVKKIAELYGVERSRLCDPLILEVFPEILRDESNKK